MHTGVQAQSGPHVHFGLPQPEACPQEQAGPQLQGEQVHFGLPHSGCWVEVSVMTSIVRW